VFGNKPEAEVDVNEGDNEKSDDVDSSSSAISSKGSLVLIEFYSPGCVHCVNFESSYNEIAFHYHAKKKNRINDNGQRVKIAKVNIKEERALAQRFNIRSLPSFFLMDTSTRKVYKFESGRSKSNLINFVDEDHKEEEPIPFLKSPLGPVGSMLGLMVSAGMILTDLFFWIQNLLGIESPIIVAFILGIVAVFGGMIAIMVLVIMTTPRIKTKVN